MKVHDTCGVNNLHGMPAILGGVVAAIASAFASFETYGHELYLIWPERTAQLTNGTMVLTQNSTAIVTGRSAISQGGYQMAAVMCTLLIAIVGGLLTGFLVRYLDTPKSDEIFSDSSYWIVPEDDVENNGSENGELKGLLVNEKP